MQISAPLTVDKTWSFSYNDQRITYEQYVANEKAHKEWVDALINSVEEIQQTTKRKKKI